MLEDARITLALAFDTMIKCPAMVSGYFSQIVKVAGISFDVQRISIGYAEFLIATNSLGAIVLLDASLRDGKAVMMHRHTLNKGNVVVTPS